MKVGTDAILLGAWCSLENYPNSILDVGAGTGVVALMLAQRSDAMTINAVEVDEKAHEQCVNNFEISDWSDRLFCYNASFEEFVIEMQDEEEKYDIIISNPPFYADAFETENESRNKARFTSSLTFENLISGTSKILSNEGEFSVIIPFKEEHDFTNIASLNSLYLNRVCRVKGTLTSEFKRSLLTFSFQKKILQEETLVIEKERHHYTQEYINLTRDFYLKM